MTGFDLECVYCDADNTCILGHLSCSLKCLDFEPVDDYLDEDSIDDDYEYDAYDYCDAYLDDKNDGLIPPDYD